MRGVTDAGANAKLPREGDRDAVGPRRGREYRPRLQRGGIQPGHAGRAAVRDQNVAIVRDNSGCFRETFQSGEVPPCIVVDDFNATSCGVRDEHTTRLRIERAVIEIAVEAVRYRDG